MELTPEFTELTPEFTELKQEFTELKQEFTELTQFFLPRIRLPCNCKFVLLPFSIIRKAIKTS